MCKVGPAKITSSIPANQTRPLRLSLPGDKTPKLTASAGCRESVEQ